MTVYTDGVHLITDQLDDAELHVLAAKIRLKRRWFQGDHYDLTTRNAAARAIDAGAVLISMMDLGRLRLQVRARRGAAITGVAARAIAALDRDGSWAPTPLDPALAADRNTELLRLFAPGKRIGIRGGDHL